jgi:hypothetical protein
MSKSFIDRMHSVGKEMIEMASMSKGFGHQSTADMNALSRIGDVLVSQGEPFAMRLSTLSKDDLITVAKHMGMSLSSFKSHAGLAVSESVDVKKK